MDIDEEVYYVLYLYNAITEYIYFVILYIEQRKFANVSDLIQYIKFFKYEIYEFAMIFGGNTLFEKFCHMLCMTSKAFMLSKDKVFLSASYKKFKDKIFESLIVTKSADLITKGIIKVQDISNNLNLSNAIHVEPKRLLTILQNSPYFEIQKCQLSASIIQFHGLLGFDNHSYKTVVSYFQSYLHNTKVMSFNEIIFHSPFVPSCGVQNVLVTFCILYSCQIFKCENNEVFLRLKQKRKPCENKTLDIKLFKAQLTAKVPLGLIIYESCGSHLQDWIGEIGKVRCNFGYIYCVVDFNDQKQETFIVYFNKMALKQVCEIENLEDYIKIHDIVKFDAMHCFKARNSNIFWKATKLEIITVSSKLSKRISKVEHSEDFWPYYKTTKEKCIHPKCSLNKFEEQLNDYEKLRYCSPNLSINKCSCFKNVNAYGTNTKYISKDQEHILENSQKQSVKIYPPHELPCLVGKVSSNSNLVPLEFPFCRNYLSDLDLPVSDALTNSETSQDNDKNKISAVEFSMQKSKYLSNIKNACSYILNFLFLEYAFVIGHVTSVMLDKGTASAIHKNRCYNIFFRKEAIFPPNECQNVLQKGKKILIFIPYIEETKLLHVATLVYPLNPSEFAESEICIIPATEQLILNSFFPNIINHTDGLQFCKHFHPIGFLLSNMSYKSKFLEYKELLDMNCDFETDLRMLLSFNNGVYHKLLWLVLYLIYEQNFKCCNKPVTDLFCLLSSAASYFNIRKSLVGPFILRRNMYVTKRKNRLQIENDCGHENHTDIFNKVEGNIVSNKLNCNGFEISVSQHANNWKFSATKTLTELLKSNEDSYCSLNSYKTCGSQSSLDTFHSCESLIDEMLLDHVDDVKQYKSNFEIPCSEQGTAEVLSSTNHKQDLTFNKVSNNSSAKHFLFTEAKRVNSLKASSKHNVVSKGFAFISPNETKFLKSLPIFKQKLKRKKISKLALGLCNSSYLQLIKTTANISVITDTCLFLHVKYKDCDTLLGYPKKIIPEEVKEKIKLNSMVEIEVIPNVPLHFSHVLSMKILDALG